MDSSIIILQLAVILISARVFGEIAGYLKLPVVIGELLAGILLGPSVLDFIEMHTVIQTLAEVGIILLLFEIGLKTHLDHLIDAGRKSVVVALGGFLAPLILCYLFCFYLMNLSLLISLMVAGTMTATSIGITMRSLSDLGEHHSRQGQIILGAAVLDDIMGVVLLAIFFDFAMTRQVDYFGAVRIILFMTAFFLLAPVLAKTVSYIVKRFEPQSALPGIVPTTIVSLVLFLAWFSHALGIPELLGGFATGLALSRRFFLPFGSALQSDENFSKHIQKQMKPIVQLFTPIFFVSVGLSIDLSALAMDSSFFWYFSLLLTVIAIISKLVGALFIQEPIASRCLIGMAMVPRGEVGLVFAELARITGIFNNEIHATVVLVIAYTTIFTPFWLKWFYRRYRPHLNQE